MILIRFYPIIVKIAELIGQVHNNKFSEPNFHYDFYEPRQNEIIKVNFRSDQAVIFLFKI